MGVPDAAAQQGHVGHHRLDKAIVGTPEDFAVQRLPHAAGGVLLGVHQGGAGQALHQQQRLTQEDAGHDILRVKTDVGLRKGDEAVGKGLHHRQVRQDLRLQGQPEGAHPLQCGILAVAVDDPQPGPPPADEIIPAHDVHAAANAQCLVEPGHVVRVVV